MAAFQAREQGVEHHIPGSSEQGVEKWGADLEGQKEGFQHSTGSGCCSGKVLPLCTRVLDPGPWEKTSAQPHTPLGER